MKPNLNWNRKCNQSISKDLQKKKERKGNRWTLHFYNSSHNDQNYNYCLNHILYSDICLDICPLSRTGSPCRVCLNSELFNSFTFSQFWEKYLDIQVSLKFTQSNPILGDPMTCSMPGFPVHPQIPELFQTPVHWVHDAIQPYHPLSTLSPAFNLFQHQVLFQWVRSLHQVEKY